MTVMEFFYFRQLSGGLPSLDMRYFGFTPDEGMAWLTALGRRGGEIILVWHYLTFDLLFPALLSLTLVFIPPVCRVSESVTTQVRGFDFVDAARASGAGTLTIVRVHVLGNVLGPILVYATSLISVAIILAAGLSFLGLGVKPPEPEWGLMLNTLRQAIYVNPVLAALPGVMIFITSICFNLMSDGLRAAMDVKA